MTALYREMAARRTPEAKLYKALDNLEAVVQHTDIRCGQGGVFRVSDRVA